MTGILQSYNTSFNKTKIFAFMEVTSRGKRQGIKKLLKMCKLCSILQVSKFYAKIYFFKLSGIVSVPSG